MKDMNDIDRVDRDLAMGSCPLPQSLRMVPLSFQASDRNFLVAMTLHSSPPATRARVATIIAAPIGQAVPKQSIVARRRVGNKISPRTRRRDAGDHKVEESAYLHWRQMARGVIRIEREALPRPIRKNLDQFSARQQRVETELDGLRYAMACNAVFPKELDERNAMIGVLMVSLSAPAPSPGSP